jgi:hypothetical protein
LQPFRCLDVGRVKELHEAAVGENAHPSLP